MAFVPGFDHDVFVSYAHGDDRDWINRFVNQLKPALSRRLPGADVWIDKDDPRKSRDFTLDIPASLQSSAVLISLVSPTYVTRPYCVHHECRRFGNLVAARKQPGQRFAASEFKADLFGFRCPILPMPDSAHWNDLIPGATDIPFCDDLDTFPVGSPSFEEQFRALLRELVPLLRRMRNHCTPVLVYPRHSAPELSEAHSALTRELDAQSYRILPEDELDPAPHVRLCDLAVLLFGAQYDETTRRLVDGLKDAGKPFVVWPSPVLENSGAPEQRGFFQYLVQLEAARKTLLSPAITPEKLKQEVFALLNPGATMPPPAEGKPRVYLVYDSRRNSEKNNAGTIAFHYRDEFHFEHSDNPRQHNLCLTQSDGVLLVGGATPARSGAPTSLNRWCASRPSPSPAASASSIPRNPRSHWPRRFARPIPSLPSSSPSSSAASSPRAWNLSSTASATPRQAGHEFRRGSRALGEIGESVSGPSPIRAR